jgi:hypothetical protein
MRTETMVTTPPNDQRLLGGSSFSLGYHHEGEHELGTNTFVLCREKTIMSIGGILIG